MQIQLTDAGKRFNRDWIFRHVSYVFESGHSYAITGPNGSGKSTLLQVIAGATQQSEGTVEYTRDNQKLEPEHFHRELTIAAPYLELIEEMTATEFLEFHASFKPLTLPVNEIIGILGMEKAAHKQIRYYSSGMKQRIKLAQAIFSDTPVIMLDEPCTNLDLPGYQLYHQLIENHCSNKLIIVSSNDANEMDFCKEKISIMDFK
ncbi:MAG: ABC transporter ATP-binding protein [Bacteroidota bacterium]|nr:ABC transporter ATP-binding protein [Bacteroidota bacterium]